MHFVFHSVRSGNAKGSGVGWGFVGEKLHYVRVILKEMVKYNSNFLQKCNFNIGKSYNDIVASIMISQTLFGSSLQIVYLTL